MYRKICDQMAPLPAIAELHVKEFVRAVDREVGNFARSDFALGLDRRVEVLMPKKENVYLALGIASIATVALAILFDHSPETFAQFKDFWKDHGVTMAELSGVAAAMMLSALIGKKTAGHKFDKKDLVFLVGIVAVTVVATLIAGDQTHVNTSAKFADFFTQEWKPLLIAGGFAALATALMKLSKHWRSDPHQRPTGIFILACAAVATLYAGIHNFNDLEHLIEQHRVAVFVGASSFAAFTAFILQYMLKKMTDEEETEDPSSLSLHGRVVGIPPSQGVSVDASGYDPSNPFAIDPRPAVTMDLSGPQYNASNGAVVAAAMPAASEGPLMSPTAQAAAPVPPNEHREVASQPHVVASSPTSPPSAMPATPDESAALAASAAGDVSVFNGAPAHTRGPATTGRRAVRPSRRQRHRDTAHMPGVDVKVPA